MDNNIVKNKINAVCYIRVSGANPNGDPMDDNQPRMLSDGTGLISDVCIKRKIRNRLQDLGGNILIVSDDKNTDGFKSIDARFQHSKEESKETDNEKVLKKFIDARLFGQVITLKQCNSHITGCVSVSMAKSLSPIDVQNIQITKSTNGQESKSVSGISSDRIGSKSFVNFAIYKYYVSLNVAQAQKNGVTLDDVAKLKEALKTLFENDASSARPEGSMGIIKMYWMEHKSESDIEKLNTYKFVSSIKEKIASDDISIPTKIYDYIIDDSDMINNYKDVEIICPEGDY